MYRTAIREDLLLGMFEYAAPESMQEATALLQQAGADGRPLAGGTDLIVQLRENRRKLQLVVDIKAIPELNELSFHTDDGLTMGAAIPCYKLRSDRTLMERYPAILDGAGIIGGTQIQGRATVGGNLCNSSPAADSVPALMVLQATALVCGVNGERRIPIADFCVAPGRTVLEPEELLVSLIIPPPGPRSGAFYHRFIPRNEMDIAVASAAAAVQLDDTGNTIRRARVALGAVGPRVMLVEEIGAELEGQSVSESLIERAGELAGKASRPITDMRGSDGQRRHLAAVLTRRALQRAIERARLNGCGV